VRYWTRRIARNAAIGVAAAATCLVVFALSHDKETLAFRWSMATGYTSVALIGLALVLGPWWVSQGRRVPVSTDVRRDVGLWGAAFGLAHVATGLKVHMGGDMLNYFVYRARDGVHRLPIRLDPFGITNWTGLAATLLLILLVVISNDRSLRALGTARWKRLQQSTYVAAVLIGLHGLAFQYMDRRTPAFVVVFLLLMGIVLAFQTYGRRQVRAMENSR
jgi:sulfoxide reductase heme-binding subunit YedZ